MVGGQMAIKSSGGSEKKYAFYQQYGSEQVCECENLIM